MVRIAQVALTVVVAFACSATAAASPSISITAPPPGNLYDVYPTITVTYAPGGFPLDLDTLQVLVNAVDWTLRFTKTPTSASYAVTPPESLVAGHLTIAASISDVNGDGASTSQDYEVFPKLVDRAPASGFEGTLVTLTVEGLDPDPSRNQVQFSGAATSMITADPATTTGSVKVPLGAITGPIFVRVNGKASPETLLFTVSREFAMCGAVYTMLN